MNTYNTFNIPGYSPCFYDTTEAFILQNHELLEGLKGMEVLSVFVAWSMENNEFWDSFPVIVKLDGMVVELCANKLDTFSVTSNTVDMNSPVFNWGELSFEWREVRNFEGAGFIIQEVKVIEVEHKVSNVSGNPGFKNQWWGLGGIQLVGKSQRLSVLNGLDCNEIIFGDMDESGIRLFEN